MNELNQSDLTPPKRPYTFLWISLLVLGTVGLSLNAFMRPEGMARRLAVVTTEERVLVEEVPPPAAEGAANAAGGDAGRADGDTSDTADTSDTSAAAAAAAAPPVPPRKWVVPTDPRIESGALRRVDGVAPITWETREAVKPAEAELRKGDLKPGGPVHIESSPIDSLGVWVAALLTLFILSFVFRDNPFYKVAESILIGVSAAYWMVLGFWSTLVPDLLGALAPGFVRANAIPSLPVSETPTSDAALAFVPLLLGFMLLWRLAPKGGWISIWPIAFIIGMTAGIRLVGAIEADLMRQIEKTTQPLVEFKDGGSPANGIALWDGTSWSTLGNGVDSVVHVLGVLPNGDLIAGGDFTTAGGVPANAVARWDGTTWTSLGTGAGKNVRALAVTPSDVLVVGGSPITGDATTASVAQWNGAAWTGIGSGLNGSAGAIARMPSGDLIVGGAFTSVGGVAASGVARWDGTAWTALGSGVNGAVLALEALPNGDLVAGGEFTAAGEVPASGVARWNGTSWSSLGSGTDGSVAALAVLPNGDLIAAGQFTTAGGAPANHIARWDGTSWSPLGAGTNDSVRSLLVLPDGNLVAGGGFTAAGGVKSNCIARWDGASWSALGPDVGGASFVSVGALAMLPSGALVAGGETVRTFDFWGTVGSLVGVIGVLSVLTYFFFSVDHKGAVGRTARVGIWFLMISFGSAFGLTVMGRITLLLQRFEFLFTDWLGIS